VVQHGLKNFNLKPLEMVTPNDVLQIIFTPIENLNAPLHDQIKNQKLTNQISGLVSNIIEDGLQPDNCTIQFYTLAHADQNVSLIQELAKDFFLFSKTANLTIEWHIIPKLDNLSSEQISRIFQPTITCYAIYHASLVGNQLHMVKTRYNPESNVTLH
jgi:hypothetical protein